MVVPIVYRKQGEGTIATYDWYDFGSSLGYKRFYAGANDDAGGAKYYLITQQIASDYTKCVITASGGGGTEANFDVMFNRPTTIKGDALVNYTARTAGGGGVTVQVIIYHVTSGGVETQLGTATHAGVAAATQYRQCLKIALTQKSFKAGESLRLCVIAVGGATDYIDIDPAARRTFVETGTGANIYSDFFVDIPFKIDL